MSRTLAIADAQSERTMTEQALLKDQESVSLQGFSLACATNETRKTNPQSQFFMTTFLVFRSVFGKALKVESTGKANKDYPSRPDVNNWAVHSPEF